MSIFYVYQGETFDIEHYGGYVWSPQLTRAGGRNPGYTMMCNVKVGDFILHNKNGKIVALSLAQTDCYEATQPNELKHAKTTIEWNDEGYRVDTEYHKFDTPLKIADYRVCLKEHYSDESAFTREGKGKQQYMCRLADEHAIFLLEKSINQQKEEDVLSYLKNALVDVIAEKDSEYDPVELVAINEAIDKSEGHPKPGWSSKREKQAMAISLDTGRAIPKRDPNCAADALKRADYTCEYDASHRLFARKNGKPYTEPHHLIPISKYRDFGYSLDVMENIVSLCSHCHNLLHYGQLNDKRPLLKEIYDGRKSALSSCGLTLSYNDLLAYYKEVKLC